MNRAIHTPAPGLAADGGISCQRSAALLAAVALTLFATVGHAQMAGACPPGSTQFDVRYDSNNGQSGNFFDVEATAGDVTITNMAINVDAGGPYNVQVWTRPGTYVGFTGSSAGWTMIVSESVMGVGLNQATPLATTFSQLVPNGQRVGFLVVLIGSTAINYTNGTAVGAISATDPKLTVYQGQGCGTPGFGAGLFTTRNWNGSLCYTTGPGCAVLAPAAGSVLTGVVQIDHDLTHPAGLATNAFYEWSTDGGMIFNPCTPTMGSANPGLGLPAPSMQTFFWDSYTDGVGTGMIQNTDIRVSLDDGMGGVGGCTVNVDMDNVAPPPTCTLANPGGAVSSNDIAVDLTPSSVNAPTVDASFEYSIDSGVTWNLATPAAPSTNPQLGLPVGVLASWTWDSRADSVGVTSAKAAVLRATVDDGVAISTGECQVPLVVNNSALCQTLCGDCSGNGVGPDIVDALTAAQIGVGLIIPTMPQIGCCDVNVSLAVDVVDSLVIAQASAGLPVTLTCPVNNSPFCILSAPGAATIVGGTVSIDFDAYSLTGNMMVAAFAYDDGAGFLPASDAGTGGLTGNPTAPFAAAAGFSWDWDSVADVVGTAFGAVIQVSLTDVGPDGIFGTADDIGPGTCDVIVDVDNGPSCNITSPAPGGSASGAASIMFDVGSPSGNPILATFEYDSGAGFVLATDAGTGTLTGNPTLPFFAGATDWTWNAAADVPMGGTGVVLRVTISDPISGLMSSCQVTVDVVLGTCMGTVEGDLSAMPLPITVPGNTAGADNTVPISCAAGGGGDHVYLFVAPMTAGYTMSLCGSGYDTAIALREMDCTTGLELACNDDSCGLQSSISVALTAGTAYWVVVDGFAGRTGAYTLSITSP